MHIIVARFAVSWTANPSPRTLPSTGITMQRPKGCAPGMPTSTAAHRRCPLRPCLAACTRRHLATLASPPTPFHFSASDSCIAAPTMTRRSSIATPVGETKLQRSTDERPLPRPANSYRNDGKLAMPRACCNAGDEVFIAAPASAPLQRWWTPTTAS